MASRTNRARWVIGLLAAALVLAGRGGPTPAPSGAEPATAAGGQSNTITDVTGRTVTVDGPPQKMVCLVSLREDMLLELGMRPVAVTGKLISHPVFLGTEGDAVSRVPGGFLAPDVEAIIGYQPELVIGLYQAHDGLTAAEQSATKNLKAGVLIGLDGNFEVITGSYLSDVLARLFTYPFEARTPGPIGGSPYSPEELAATKPDIPFVLTYNNADPNAPPLSEVLARNPLWGQPTAVRTGAAHEVDTGLRGNGRGTRSLGAVAEETLKLAGPRK